MDSTCSELHDDLLLRLLEADFRTVVACIELLASEAVLSTGEWRLARSNWFIGSATYRRAV
jgi:hypothetical protein